MAPRATDRAVTTCRACRQVQRRKVGCDRQRPACGPCRAGDIVCVYEGSGPRSYQFIQETPGQPTSGGVRGNDDDAPETAAPSSVPIPEHRFAALEARVKSLSDMLSSLQQSNSSSRTMSPLPAAGFEDEQSARGPAGYLSQQGDGKVRYVNLASWSAMCRDAVEIDGILSAQSQVPGASNSEIAARNVEYDDDLHASPAATMNTLGTALPANYRIGLNVPASLWAEYPSKNFCDQTLKWWFQGYHPLVPLVHIPSFRQEYEQFWSAQGHHYSRASKISFAAMLLSFCYAGVVANGARQQMNLPGLTSEETGIKLYDLTTRALKLARFPHAPTLDTLRAYLIQKSIRLREEEPLSSVAFLGLSLRVANMLGLHKDPKHFPQLTAVEGEVRRRVWWKLVHLDVCLAVASGLPPLIDPKSWDVQYICELRDDLIGTAAGNQYLDDVREGRRQPDSAANPCDISATSMVTTGGILAASKYRFTFLQRSFLTRLERPSALADEASEIRERLEQLGDQLQQAIARIAEPTTEEIMGAGPETAYGESLVLNQWARLLLSTYCDQRFSLISYPLSSVPSWKGWDGLHEQTIESTISFLRKCARLSTNVLYRRFHWTWPGNHQPLHAIVLLLNEVPTLQDPQTSEKVRSVVDIIFALAHESTGLTTNVSHSSEPNARVLREGGSEVWRFLKRLRARAWRKKNWDPGNELSREQATMLCQSWFAGDGGTVERLDTSNEEQLPAEAGASYVPTMDFLEHDLLYWPDFTLPDVVGEAGWHGEAGEPHAGNS